MSTLITNIQDSSLTDALSQTDADEVIFIHADSHEDSNNEELAHEQLNDKDHNNSPDTNSSYDNSPSTTSSQDNPLFSNLNLPMNVLIEKRSVSLDDLESTVHELHKIISDVFEKSSDVYFALEGNLLGWQILEAAKTFNMKKVYVLQAGKLKEFEVCFIEGC